MKTILYLAVAVGLAAACTNKTEKATEETTSEPSNESVVVKVNTPDIASEALNNYLKLKDVLVQTDSESAKTAGEALSTSLSAENFDASLVEAANLIASSDDVEVQRAAFKTITDGLIEALKSNGEEDGLFVQYCPMAFGNSGASWLSLSEEIRNPYFGDRMLKCGRVTEEL